MARQTNRLLRDPGGSFRRALCTLTCASAALALVTTVADLAAAQVAGTLDPMFGVGGTVALPLATGSNPDEAYALAIDRDDRILVSGYVKPSSALPESFAVVRLLDDGDPDPAFGGGGTAIVSFQDDAVSGTENAQARAMAVQANGRIVLAGNVRKSGDENFAVARLLENGGPDSSFSGDGLLVTEFQVSRDDAARAVALQDDGKVVVAGFAAVASSNRDVAIARYETDGDLDPAFSGDGLLTLDFGNASGIDEAAAVAIDADDRIVVAGSTADGGARSLLVFRLTSSGSLDPDFNGGSGSIQISFGDGESYATALAIQPDGSILVAGNWSVGNVVQFGVARLEEDGTLDPSFGTGGLATTPIGDTAEARAIALHESGRFTVAGFARVEGTPRFAAAQYRADGSLDPTFGTLGTVATGVGALSNDANAIVQQPDGKLVLAGRTTPSGSLRDFGLVRLTYSDCGDGLLDAPEQCDGDDLGGVTCCSLACTIAGAGTECRATGGACDVSESCNGVAATCPADQFVGTGTTCRATQGWCDLPEACTGSGPACPADLHVAAGTLCRAALGSCDLAESCDGAASCPNDARVTAGTPCRTAADTCDAVESCDGSASICPADLPATVGTVCRLAGDACDAAESCDGATFACPADLPATVGTSCRDVAGGCDVAESCDGASFACPADEVAAAGVSCRVAATACDADETCDGAAAACPSDQQLPDGDADGTCDAQDVCPLASDPAQTDGDGDGLGDVCDPCTSGVLIDKPVLRAEGLLTPAGDDTFVLKGELVFSPARPALDPLVNGMRVRVEDGGGTVLFDAVVPPGAYDQNTRVGWRRNVNRTLHRFRSPTAFGNLVNKVKMVTRTLTPDLVDLKITGRNADFTALATATGPLRAIMVIDPPGAVARHCGERTFPGPAPEPACSYLTPGPEDEFEAGAVFECR